MKQNRVFAKCIGVSVIGGFLVNVRSLFFSSDAQIIQALLQNGYAKSLMDLGNNFQTAFLPGLAAGFAGLMMIQKLHLWQGCLLCLSIPFFDVLFQCVVMPFLTLSNLSTIRLSSIAFNYTVNQTHSFSVFFIALVFYGIFRKDKLVVLLCTLWNTGRYFLLYLLPPLFPQFNLDKLSMDQGELTKRTFLYGLSYTAVILLLFFAVYDLRKLSCSSKNKLSEPEAADGEADGQ